MASSDVGKEEKQYFCQRCLNHNLEFPRKGHKPHCRFASCTCDLCAMVETRRQLNNQLNKQVPRMKWDERRTADGRKLREPCCARCATHGLKVPLRGHKKNTCPYEKCTCSKNMSYTDCFQCDLVLNRRHLMADQIRLRRGQKKRRAGDSVRNRCSVDIDSDSASEADSMDTPAPTLAELPCPQPIRVPPMAPICLPPTPLPSSLLSLFSHSPLLPMPMFPPLDMQYMQLEMLTQMFIQQMTSAQPQ